MMTFRAERVNDHITRIHAPGTEMMYLVTGTERAALLDTGCGFGDLRAVVDELTDLPVIVLVTHGHVDHAMGSAQFEEVYMNLDDAYIYAEHGKRSYRMAGLESFPCRAEYTASDYIETAPLSHYHDMRGGSCFALGGVTIRIYDCPGHTRGSVVMLLEEDRILLTGDACNEATFMFEDYSTSIAEYRASLQRLQPQIAGRYDRVLTSHHRGEVPVNIVEGVIAVCDDILAGRTDDIPLPIKGGAGLIAKAVRPDLSRLDGGVGNIAYSKSKIQ